MNAIPEPNAHVTPTNTYSFTDESLAARDARVRAEALAPIEGLAEEWGHPAALYALRTVAAPALRAAMEAKG